VLRLLSTSPSIVGMEACRPIY